MSAARLRELAALHALPEGAAAQLSRLLELVDAAAISITTVHGAQAVEVHIADSRDKIQQLHAGEKRGLARKRDAIGGVRCSYPRVDLGEGGREPCEVLWCPGRTDVRIERG